MKSRRRWQRIIETLDREDAVKLMEMDKILMGQFQEGILNYGEYVKKLAHHMELFEADGVEIIDADGNVSAFYGRVYTEIKLVAVIGKVPQINVVDIAKQNREIFVYTGE